ncbi:MAG: PIG-L deacetylase family protein [Actinomycetes bacterium]
MPHRVHRAPTSNGLPTVKEVLAVCAHPDDETFGLGAVLAALSEHDGRSRVLCFTHGEASTLGDTGRPLGDVRAEELDTAARILGIDDVTLLSYPDGLLDEVPIEELTHRVDEAVESAQLLLVFDEGGITGHPDHCRATEAALLAAKRRGLPVLAWVMPERIAAQLNAEYGTSFVGRPDGELDIVTDVDRNRQRDAIACHASQSGDNPVLWRRLELLGDQEHLHWLAQG